MVGVTAAGLSPLLTPLVVARLLQVFLRCLYFPSCGRGILVRLRGSVL